MVAMDSRRSWCRVGTAWISLISGVVGCGGAEFSADEKPEGTGGSAASSGGTAGATGGSGGGGSAGKGGSSMGTGGSTGGGSSRSALEACLAFTTATCEWQARCLGQHYYPSADVCFEQTRHYCEDGGYGLGLDGTLVAAADFDACTVQADAADCMRSWAYCTLPAGELPVGAPCQSTLQCASSRCSGGGYTCGTCLAAPGPPGTACVSAADCRQDSTCIDGVCLRNSLEGETCDDEAPCAQPSYTDSLPDGRLLCVEGTCTMIGKLGEPCYTDAAAVELCGYLSACGTAGTCVPVEMAKSGEPCGTFSDVLRSCEVGSCMAPADGGETVCVPHPGPGEECRSDLQNCEWTLTCTTGGRCAWPSPMAVTPCEE
jgi:hypothetical protein